ncbi:hypothetical protein [Candidatus Korobacter versatilis]|nr:hypothetical protein [Candidatus Koribacter versatilis]
MSENATSQLLARIVGKCPICKLPPRRHAWSQLASTICGDPSFQESLANFFQLFRTHEWMRLRAYQGFDPMRDAVVVYAVRCPDGGALVLAVRSNFDLYAPDELYGCEIIDAKASDALCTQLENWEDI